MPFERSVKTADKGSAEIVPCCAACIHLTLEGECDWRFEQIPEEEVYDSYCDMFEEIKEEY